ncbi:hypothetical protein F53441_4957 [Fusarium austroafricanum]|uniref:Methyltransferase domain-containing protein n=1 Tax=Fusarium austroafricanum TaxID=2364996 RepID=A0A8H4P8T9_9HYPO|nr:hypothetical protein F53441_4957 [Fusarium austroafricanum]
MSSEDIYTQVSERYGSAAKGSYANSNNTIAKAFGYSEEELASIPKDANLGLSCGTPLAIATLREGEAVVDLGSGAGLDVFLSAKKDMLAKALKLKADRAMDNVEFVESRITKIALEDCIADCIISNCVVNLVPHNEKQQAFNEMFRLLKPGGRVAISDILAKKPLPDKIRNSMALYVGCIAGASQVVEYEQYLCDAGFKDILITDTCGDLNVYLTAPTEGCCSGSGSMASDLDGEDLNEWCGVAIRGHLRGVQFPIPESPASSSSPSLDSNTQQLLEYYDKNIARLLVWIDSERNYYRQKVLPLAQTNEAVRLAICAVSAQHAAKDFTPSSIYEKDRDHVLSMIMRGVNDMSAHPQLSVSADTAEWMLSSMMVLSSYELAHSGGADAADFHRKAARALVNTLSTVDFPKSSLFGFLQNQLSMYDIFACTTILDATDVQDAIRPVECGDDRSFSAYLRILQDATLISRGDSAHESNRDWRNEFVQARGETLMEIGSTGVCSSANRGDFIRLVDAYHNAALLYTARCLDQQYGPEETVALFDLFRLLTGMENLHNWIHNLAWPIFIAGTECYGDGDRQLILRDLYRTMSDVTGFKHHGDVLTFLESFWSSGESDWRILAKQWEGLGRRILAV